MVQGGTNQGDETETWKAVACLQFWKGVWGQGLSAEGVEVGGCWSGSPSPAGGKVHIFFNENGILMHSGTLFNPLKPNSANCYTLPNRPNPPFLISDIRAL